MSKNVLVFEVYRNGELQRTERLDREIIKIGSLPTSHLRLEDTQVSGIHAVIEVSGDSFNLIDLGSTYGTRLNGERVNRHELSDGDVLEVGETRIIFRVERVLPQVQAPELSAKSANAGPAGATRPASPYRYLTTTHRPSDVKHYSRRFLSQPSRTDGTVEVAHLWRDHIMSEITLSAKGKGVSVGTDARNSIVIDHESIPGPTYELISQSPDGSATLNLAPSMEGDVYVEAERLTIADAIARRGASIPITAKTRSRIRFGESTIFVHQGTKPNLALPLGGFEGHLGLYFVFSVVIHAVILGMIFLAPPGSKSLDIDAFDLDESLVDIAQFEEEQEAEELPELLSEDEEEEELAAMEDGEEGRAGLEEEVEEEGRMAVEGPEDNEQVTLDEIQAREEAMERGVVSVLQEFQGPQSIFGTTAMGYDDVMAFGAQTGTSIGPAQGSLGLAVVGSGRSGGGNHPGGIGIGRISTAGRFGQDGDADLGRNLNRMRERVPTEVEVALGNPNIEGHLDRETIQRVIRQHRREIRDCYQRELQRNPDLSGRVVVAFMIDPAGNVARSSVAESDIGDDNVEECLVNRIRRWRFPAPSTPGNVRVNYPFVFTSG